MSYHYSTQQPYLEDQNSTQTSPMGSTSGSPTRQRSGSSVNQEQGFQWSSNYAQSNIPTGGLGTTPRLQQHNELSPTLNPKSHVQQMSQQQQQLNLYPYGSPTSQFNNPWSSSQRSPSQAHSQFSPQSASTVTGNSIVGGDAALMTPNTRSSYYNSPTLPTTYEYQDYGAPPQTQPQQQPRKNSLIYPPKRAPAPPPTYFADQSVTLNDLHRRQSVATVPTPQPLSQAQAQLSNFTNRRPSLVHGFQLKQMPPPTLKQVLSKADLHPVINKMPKYRRASMATQYISPLMALTTEICTTFTLCNTDFHYEVSNNPKRVLTKPSEGKSNNGFDNEEGNLIVYVNDVLGQQDSKKYLVLDVLGKGTFAQVVKCQDLSTKEFVAIKIVKCKHECTYQSLAEVALLEFINQKVDPNDKFHLLRLKDKFLFKNHLCIVFELLSSNLFELVKQNEYKGLNIGLVRKFSKQLLEALCVLKRAEIIHCDLKPENILLISPDKPDIKIVDFGSACKEHQTLYTYVQSRFYRSPEVILGLPYSSSIDVWSLGCVIAELFLGLPLFAGSSEYDQLLKIVTILGMPPSWMIDMGRDGLRFFEKTEDHKYKMKSLAKYCEEYKLKEKPGDKFLKSDDLQVLITKYDMNRKSMTSTMIEKENNDRESLLHLLRGLLIWSPLQRWTPQQAILHPFITGEKFTGSWSPPGSTGGLSDSRSNSSRKRSV